MTTATEVFESMKKHVSEVGPGTPAKLTPTNTVGDNVQQGDLIIEIIDEVPGDYVMVQNPTDADRQLVPLGGGPGSHHRIKSLAGVTMYRPVGWGLRESDTRGPVLVLATANVIEHDPGHAHPHADVTIEGPMTIGCTYQRNLNAEGREVRALD